MRGSAAFVLLPLLGLAGSVAAADAPTSNCEYSCPSTSNGYSFLIPPRGSEPVEPVPGSFVCRYIDYSRSDSHCFYDLHNGALLTEPSGTTRCVLDAVKTCPSVSCDPGSYVDSDSNSCKQCSGSLWSSGGTGVGEEDQCYATPDCDGNPNYKLNESKTGCICPTSQGFQEVGYMQCNQICKPDQRLDPDSRRCYNVPDCSTGGKLYNEEENVCECAQGYILKNDICVEDLPQGCQSVEAGSTRCQACSVGYSLDPASQSCKAPLVCEPGSYTKADGSSCTSCGGGSFSDGKGFEDSCYPVPECNTNEVLNADHTACVCPSPGFIVSASGCAQVCSSTQKLNDSLDSLRCYDVPDCSATGTKLDEENNKCFCLDGYEMVGSSCMLKITCSANTYLSSRTCVACPTGTTSSGGAVTSCTAITCGSNEKLDGNVCKCSEGYSKVGTSSTCTLTVPTCGTNEKLDGNVCKCSEGYSKIGSLTACTLIVPTCGSNEELVNNVCKCKTGFEKQNNVCSQIACSSSQIRDPSSHLCVSCPPGLTPINGRCSPSCGTGSTLDSTSNTCVCTSGYTLDSSSKACVMAPPQCRNGFSLDALKKKCVCGQGKEEKLGFCVETLKCLEGFFFDNLFKVCVCLWPNTLDKNGKCKRS